MPAGGTAEPIAGQELHNEPATVAISYPSAYGPSLGQLLRPFGATPGLIDDLNSSPRYALVGALSPSAGQDAGSFDAPEASPQIRAGATGELQGVLARGKQNMWYGPAAANIPIVRIINGQQQPPTVVNYGLYYVLSQVTAPWPVPSGADGLAQAAALRFLSEKVCGPTCPDIRDEYDSLANTIQNWKGNMKTVPFEAGHGFDETTFNTVRKQLQTELADRIRLLIGPEAGLTEKKMFGCPSSSAATWPSPPVGQGGALARVDPQQSEALIATTPASVMERRGRPMPGWLRLSSEDLDSDDDLAAWVERGTGYARSLPAKR